MKAYTTGFLGMNMRNISKKGNGQDTRNRYKYLSMKILLVVYKAVAYINY